MALKFSGKVNHTGKFRAGADPVDSLFENVITLMNFESGITDLVPGNVWTLGGSATVSSAQAKFGSNSVFVPAGNNALTIPNNDLGNFLQGAFTVEMWYYYTGAAQGDARLFQTRNGDVISGLTFGFDSSGTDLALVASSTGASQDVLLLGGPTPLLNQWNHIACTRDENGTLTLWLNGEIAQQGSISGSLYWDNSHTTVVGGQTINVARSSNGYIDDLRITVGVARYTTSSFTPPSQAFTPVASSIALLDFESGLADTADGTNTWSFIDAGSVTSAQARFGTQSMDVTGTGTAKGAKISNTDLGNYLTGQFTVEMWVYPLGSPSSSGRLFQSRDGDVFSGLGFGYDGLGPGLYLFASTVNTGFDFVETSANGLNNNEWNHVAAARDASGNIALWVNGEVRIRGNIVGALYWNTADLTIVGGQDAGAVRNINGYIDEVLISDGVTKYDPASSFTPPVRTFPATKHTPIVAAADPDPQAANVVSLLGFDGDLTDAVNGVVWTPINGASVIADQNFTKFNQGSLLLNGVDQIITCNNNLVPTSTDFTVEAWVSLFNFETTNTFSTVYAQYLSSSGSRTIFRISNTGRMSFFNGVTGAIQASTGPLFVLNKWTHVVWQRSGNTLSMWQDGVLVSETVTGGFTVYQGGANNARIGHLNFEAGVEYWDGYVDEFRVTQAARYTTGQDFTPPTLPFPRS